MEIATLTFTVINTAFLAAGAVWAILQEEKIDNILKRVTSINKPSVLFTPRPLMPGDITPVGDTPILTMPIPMKKARWKSKVQPKTLTEKWASRSIKPNIRKGERSEEAIIAAWKKRWPEAYAEYKRTGQHSPYWGKE